MNQENTKVTVTTINSSSLKISLGREDIRLILTILDLLRLDIDEENYNIQFGDGKLRPSIMKHNNNYYLAKVKDNDVYVPIGFKKPIIELLYRLKRNGYNIDIEINDKIKHKQIEVSNINTDNSIQLRDSQKEAIQKILEERFLTIRMPTGGGKTYIAMTLLKLLPTYKVLYLVNTITLLNQTYKVMKESIEEKDIGLVGDGNFDISKRVTLGLPNSFYHRLKRLDKEGRDQIINHLRSIDILMVDEPQEILGTNHGYITSFLCINRSISCALSATPWVHTGKNPMISALTGPVLYSKTAKEFIDREIIHKPSFCIYEAPNITLSRRTLMKYSTLKDDTIRLTQREKCAIFRSIDYEAIIHNNSRNQLASEIIVKEIDRRPNNAPVLIVVKTINKKNSHGEIIKNSILRLDPNKKIYILSSSLRKKDKEEIFKLLEKGEIDGLIVTSKLFGTGIDIPSLCRLVIVHDNYNSKSLIQLIGRLVRKSKEDNITPRIIDFNDKVLYYAKQSDYKRAIYAKSYDIDYADLEPKNYYKDLLIHKYSPTIEM